MYILNYIFMYTKSQEVFQKFLRYLNIKFSRYSFLTAIRSARIIATKR
nr:MAG TPA: hypothetical protein [Caudoviricetes sp.]